MFQLLVFQFLYNIATCATCVSFVIVNGGLVVCVGIQIRPRPGNLSDTADRIASTGQNEATNMSDRSDNVGRETHSSSATGTKSRSVKKSSRNASASNAGETADELSSHVNAQSTTNKAHPSSNSDSRSPTNTVVNAAATADKLPSSNTLRVSAHSATSERDVGTQSSAVTSKSRTPKKSSHRSAANAAETATNKSPSRVNAQSAASTDTAVQPQSSNSDTQLSPSLRKRKPPTRPYVYTPIRDIESGTIVNVFGVVKYVRPATRTRGLGEQILRCSQYRCSRCSGL